MMFLEQRIQGKEDDKKVPYQGQIQLLSIDFQ